MLRRSRLMSVTAAALTLTHACFVHADYTTALNTPNNSSGSTYAPNATIQYGGTCTWTAGWTPVQRVLVEFEWTYCNPYEDARNQTSGSSGTGDTEYANISSRAQTTLSFTSSQIVVGSVTYPAVPLTATQVNRQSSYYWVVATPLGEGSAPLLTFQTTPVYGIAGWYYCY